MMSLNKVYKLPATFGDSGKFAFESKFAETETTETEEAHIGARASASLTTINFSGGELRSSFGFDDE